MTIAIMTAADPGELILAEELTHHTLKPLVDYLGLRVRGVKTDRNGMLPDALRTMCQRQKVRAIYLMPTGLNPRAMTMSLARREELIAVAREFNLLIIENDSSGPLQIDRPPPCAALAPDLYSRPGHKTTATPEEAAGLMNAVSSQAGRRALGVRTERQSLVDQGVELGIAEGQPPGVQRPGGRRVRIQGRIGLRQVDLGVPGGRTGAKGEESGNGERRRQTHGSPGRPRPRIGSHHIAPGGNAA